MTDAVDPTAPLSGLRVLDLTRLFPGAYCTVLLADLGAEILKIEAPGYGDGLRFLGEPFPAAHVALNRGKRSLTLNLKSPSAGDVLHRLARDADVVVESGRPGALDKLGAGFDNLRAGNPGLIWCSITGFGPDGPNVDAPGHDLTYLGYAGVLRGLAVDGVPPIPATPITLQMAGAIAAFGIVAAVHGRTTTGVGTRVDANMVDAGIWMNSEQLTRRRTRRSRAGARRRRATTTAARMGAGSRAPAASRERGPSSSTPSDCPSSLTTRSVTTRKA